MRPNWPIFAAAASVVAAMMSAVKRDPDVQHVVATPIEPLYAGPAVPELTGPAVGQYAFHGCTDREIADRFLVEETVLRRKFSDELRVARGLRSFALRKAETELATAKQNGPMLIWLGRNELGQSLSPTTPGEPEPELDEKVG